MRNSVIRREIRSLSPYLMVEIVFALLANTALICIPIIYKQALDFTLPRGQLSEWLNLLLIYFCLILLHLLFVYLSERALWFRSLRFERRLKNLVFTHLLDLPYLEFRRKKTAEYLSLSTVNITTIEQDYLNPLLSLIKCTITLLIYAVVVIMTTHWLIFLSLFLGSLLSIISPQIMRKALSAKQKAYVQAQAKYLKVVADLLAGFDFLDPKIRRSFLKKNKETTQHLRDKRYEMGLKKVLSLLISGFFLYLLSFFVFALSGSLILKGALSIGVFVASFTYIESFLDPLQELIYCLNTINSTEEIRRELDSELSKPVVSRQLSLQQAWQRLELRDLKVDFEQKTLKFNQVFEQGKKYLLQGQSGSGKTTLLRVLQGKEEYTGQILLDGKESSLSEADYFYLAQDQAVFADSYLANVEIYQAYPLEKALYQDVMDLRGLYEVADATKLSGGEQEMLKFERAINTKKPILLLDEPFSGLDQARIDLLLSFLEAYDGTVILVSHEQRNWTSTWLAIKLDSFAS